MKFIILYLLFISDAHSYILVYKNYRLAKPEKTKVNISSEGCGANIPDGELVAGIKRSIKLWNDVPESRLNLVFGGTSGTSVASATIPAGEVIIGCASLSGASGITVHDQANGSARISLNSNEFTPGSYTKDGLDGVIMHELGHAIGLHHSKDPASVMTYESNGWTPMPTYLAQDDVDGVTYLYPHKQELGGLMGSCNSFASNQKNNNSLLGVFLGQMISSFAFSFILLKFFKFIKRHSAN